MDDVVGKDKLCLFDSYWQVAEWVGWIRNTGSDYRSF
jgi:hypothetical protein